MHSLSIGLGLQLGSGTPGGVPTIPMDALVNFSSGTGALTAAKFNAGVIGAAWAKNWIENHNGVPSSNTDTVIADHSAELPFEFNVGGTKYNGTEGQGMTLDFSLAPTSYDAYQLSVAAEEMESFVSMDLIQSNVVLSSDNYFNDLFAILAGANYTIGQIQHRFAGDTRIICAHSESSLGCEIPFTTGDWLLRTIYHDVAGGKGHVLIQKMVISGGNAAFGDLLGYSVSNHNAAPPGIAIYLTIQAYLRLALAPSTGDIKIAWLAFNESNPNFPAYTIPGILDPEDVVATQTAPSEVTLSFNPHNCQIVDIQRSKNGSGFTDLSLLYNTVGAFTYIDTDLSDADEVSYRLRVNIAGQTSDYVTSNEVTINNTFTPPTGCLLWLKADTLSLSADDPITTWSDSSGSANHVTQATGANKPTYKTNLQNSLPGVRGDGGDSLANATHITASEVHTIIGVAKVSSSNSSILFYVGNTASNGWGLFQDGSGNFCHFFGGAVSKAGSPLSATDYVIFAVTWNGTMSTLWINGVEDTLTDPASLPVAPSGTTQVLGNPSANGWTGDLLEILVWPSSLSTLNRTMVQDYLSFKYDIPVA